MKPKIIFAILLMACTMFAGLAQEDATLNLKNNYREFYTGTSSDVITDSLGTWTRVWYIDASKKYTASVYVDADTTDASSSANFALYGSMTGSTTTDLISLGTGSTLTWAGAADTTFTISTGTGSVSTTETVYHAYTQANTIEYLSGVGDSVGSYKDTTTVVHGALVDTSTVTSATTVDKSYNYPYLVLVVTATSPNDLEVQKVNIVLSEAIKED